MEATAVKNEPGSTSNDPRQRLQHVLGPDEGKSTEQEPTKRVKSRKSSPGSKGTIWVAETGKEPGGEEEKSAQSDSYSRAAEVNSGYAMTVVHTRRNANGTIGSVYSGNKIRHLKKDDGIPLWRKDIQCSFLRAVFEDETPVFTLDSDGSKGKTFADIYINAMARSSKTSKVLREKLLSDRPSAQNMAMICLLVNVGRMNTTLNFFPEMRAQLRTYHSIPCLQVHQDANSQYKGLQDAPRLKSILKGSCEDVEQPNTIEKIRDAAVPRTNPVNLIFVLSQYAPKISELHFFPPRDFFDLVIRPTLSSKSRAKAFLWLVWWYLESDFSREAALNNPFGPGQPDEAGSMPIKVPHFEHLTEEQANLENVDTDEEKAYGEKMRIVRKKILEEDETVGPPVKKPAGRLGESFDDRHVPSPARSGLDTRSPSPNGTPLNMPKPRRIAARDADGERQPRLILRAGSKYDRNTEPSSPIPPGPGHSVFNTTPHTRRARPETSHQRAVNQNRKMRIDSILYKKQVREQDRIHRLSRTRRITRNYTSMTRIFDLPEDYDTEDETSKNWGPGGLVPGPNEMEDFGYEASFRKKVVNRALRRLGREGTLPGLTRSLTTARKGSRMNGGRDESPSGKASSSRTRDKSRNERMDERMEDLMDGDDIGDDDDDSGSGLDDSDGDDATEDGMVD